MRSSIFIDTSFLLALVIADDEHHPSAMKWQNQLVQARTKSWTTEAVLLEMMNSLCFVDTRAVAVMMYRRLLKDPMLRVIPFSTEWREQSLDMYEARPDKEWSLTDCFSFLVMQDEQITDALTGDHHFEQAGFRALLRQEPPRP